MSDTAWIVLYGLGLLLHLGLVQRWITDAGRTPRLRRRPIDLPDPCPTVSVVIPARNEEDNIAACLRSVLGSEYDALRVVLVDDRSTDRTAEIAGEIAADDTRLTVLAGEERPFGWAGKNWAIHQGAQASSGEFVLILDADTAIEPTTVAAAVAEACRSEAGLLTLFPRVAMRTVWERAILPVLSITAPYRVDRINDPDDPEANAFGYFLLFRRSVYEAIGGHEAIRDKVVEDFHIAHRTKRQGHRLRMVVGSELLTKAFGPGFGDIRQGFVKNFMDVLQSRRLLAALAFAPLTLLAGFLLLPWVGLAHGAWVLVGSWTGAATSWKLGVSILGISLMLLMTVQVIRRLMRLVFELDDGGIWLQPLGVLLVMLVWYEAIGRILLGMPMRWRGRAYAARPA